MNKYVVWMCAMTFMVVALVGIFNPSPVVPPPGEAVAIYRFSPLRSDPVAVSLADDSPINIRLLVLKHSVEQMADDDAFRAVRGAERARAKGLAITVIGNENTPGISRVEEVVEAKVGVSAVPDDTLIIHTIGHGHPNGSLDNIGQRSKMLKVFASAAEKYQQDILWWQLSCHAAARLPGIDTLTPEQQERLSALASSTASQMSPTVEQAEIMGKLFMALAEKSKAIDANGDGTITVGEFKAFLNGLDNRRRGELVFSNSNERPIFGRILLMRLIPIVDRNNPQKQYPRDYIPAPNGR